MPVQFQHPRRHDRAPPRRCESDLSGQGEISLRQSAEQIRRGGRSQGRADELLFSNNSSIRVGVSLRSGTLQYLHISEYGQVCAHFPEKAREIRTGALTPCRPARSSLSKSTGEGQEGHYFDLCEAAKTMQRAARAAIVARLQVLLLPMVAGARIPVDPASVPIPETFQRLLRKLKETSAITLDARAAGLVRQKGGDPARRHEARVP